MRSKQKGARITIVNFQFDTTRAGQVSRDVLGDYFTGTLVTDCYSAYFAHTAGAKQKCPCAHRTHGSDWQKLTKKDTANYQYFAAVRQFVSSKVACVILAYKVRTAQERRSAVHALNGSYGYSVEGPVWLRRFVGDEKLFYSLRRVTFGKSSSSGEKDSDPFDDYSLAEAVAHLNAFPAFRDLKLSFAW